MKKRTIINIQNILIVLLLAIAIINLFSLVYMNNKIYEIAGKASEPAILPKIALTVITDPGCADCFDINSVVESVKKSRANVTKQETLDFNKENVKEFIKKYDIERIPTIIVTGELDKYSNSRLEKKDSYLIFTQKVFPYLDTSTNQVVGRVKVINLGKDICEHCIDLSPVISQLKIAGVSFSEQKDVDGLSDEGSSLILKYKIDKLPTLILSKDFSVYEKAAESWAAVGTIEKDGSYVFRNVQPPFYDINSRKVKGSIDIIYLIDKDCAECYDVMMHKAILTNPQGLNLKLKKETTLDISSKEGISLTAKYNITSIPTIIISEEASLYPALVNSWQQVGSIEEDGKFVFRQNNIFGDKYKDMLRDVSGQT